MPKKQRRAPKISERPQEQNPEKSPSKPAVVFGKQLNFVEVSLQARHIAAVQPQTYFRKPRPPAAFFAPLADFNQAPVQSAPHFAQRLRRGSVGV